jgi:TonB family protein
METVVQRPADAELHLLTQWGDPDAPARRKKAVVGTVLVHVVVIAGLMAVPPNLVEPEKPRPEAHVTILEPLTQLTQKAPNKTTISEEFRPPAPRVPVSAPPAPKPKAEAPRQAVIPPAPPPRAGNPTPALPDPPKLENTKEPPKADLPPIAQVAPPPPPQIQSVEKPKLTFDPVEPPKPATAPGQGRMAIPSTSVNDAIRDVARSGGSAGAIGDPGAAGSGYGSITQSPGPGTPLASVELKGDTQGVDFKPYLIQLIQTVKRNWMAVMPESVKLGRRGKVVLQFSIANDGHVVKLVYAQNSGSDALDKAAVAGISASNPFPPLPREFKGDRIVLQLNFVYR